MPTLRKTGTLVLVLLLLPSRPTPAEEAAPLDLADLPAYRRALNPRVTREPPAAVGFRDLWDKPEAYQGQRVAVSGRVVRRFRQGAFGTFPALTETWVVSPAGDPLCLVSPAVADQDREIGPGATVRFVGTYLKRVEYQAGDGKRLAPLIVGDQPPESTGSPPLPLTVTDGTWRLSADWAVGLGLAAVVVLALVRQSLRRPLRRAARPTTLEPPPEFLDAARTSEQDANRNGPQA